MQTLEGEHVTPLTSNMHNNDLPGVPGETPNTALTPLLPKGTLQKPPTILLNIPSEANLNPPTIDYMSPKHPNSPNYHRIDMEKYKLRSPTKATQEEIDLTKRYMYTNEQIK